MFEMRSLSENQDISRIGFLLETLGEKLFTCLFHHLKTVHISWFMILHHSMSFHFDISFSAYDPLASSYKHTCGYI